MASSSNECLLDADSNRPPKIHIKTGDPMSQNRTWTRLVFWLQKNTILFIEIIMAFLITLFLCFSPITTSSSSDILHAKLDLYPPHQNKLRANPSYEYLDPDTYLNWDHHVTNASTRVKAAFVVNAREEDIYKLHYTMLDIERHFNDKAGYPWVIIGHKVFSRHFREWITSTTKSPVSFGLAPSIEWQEPYWIDIKRAEQMIKIMTKKDLPRGESMHWRRMTRYNAGFIAFHPLLKDLEFYWKVQPGSRYHCDIQKDPFQKMKDEGKKFSFALTKTENHEFIQEFDPIVKNFIRQHKDIIVPVKKSIYPALLNDASRRNVYKIKAHGDDPLGEYSGSYSNCMIYNNFMIVSLNFLRSKEYNLFFDALDTSGGFFYQRWGDSFPQTFAAALFLNRREIAYNHITGYDYDYGVVCPKDIDQYVDLKCTCNPMEYRVSHMSFCSPILIETIEEEL